jgi:hypothetical protein
VVAEKPYDPKVSVTKLEHIGHVQKRIGARLRRLLKEKTGSNLHNGKPLGGKGHFTQSETDKLQNYYGLTIRENVNNLEAMKTAVWVVIFHKLSMNDKPQNGLSPSGDDIWCKFKNHASPGLACQQKHSLLAAVMDAIKPVFKDLVSVHLLMGCLYGTTHNPNEGVNPVILKSIPKRLGTLKFGVYDAVLCFINDGVAKKNGVLYTLGVRSGLNTVTALKQKEM